MKPQTALKFKYSVTESYTREEIEAARDAWVKEYEEIAKTFPEKRALCETLTARAAQAAALLADRVVPKENPSFALSHDEYYYEWLEEQKAEENAALDGDFPLGNEEDMTFASFFFNVRELALLQVGLADRIDCGKFTGYNTDVRVREGFVAEMQGNYREAAIAYNAVFTSKMVQDRQFACYKKVADGKLICPACYGSDLTAMDGTGVRGKPGGETVTLEICPDTYRCNTCGAVFKAVGTEARSDTFTRKE